MVVITIETSVRPGMQYDAGTTMSVASVMNITGKKIIFPGKNVILDFQNFDNLIGWLQEVLHSQCWDRNQVLHTSKTLNVHNVVLPQCHIVN